MRTVTQALALGLQQHRAGNLRQAEQIYRTILQSQPRQADALHLLGLAIYQRGRPKEACKYLRQALRLQPAAAELHYNLGSVLQALGQHDEARACFRQALRHQPNYPEAHNNLAVLLQQHGQRAEAIEHWREALRLKPDYAEASSNLGAALQQQGHLEEAVACLQQALRLRPDYAKAHSHLGRVLHAQGRLADAVASYQQAIRLQPEVAETHYNLGNVLREQGQWAEAAACYRQALRLKPDYAEAHGNLGVVLQKQGQWAEAVACYRQALRYQPEAAEVHSNLGDALREQGQLAEAVLCLRQALRLKPDFPEAHNNLGTVLQKLGQLDEAVASFQQALRCQPDFAFAHQSLLLTLQYCPRVTLQELAEAHAEFERRHAVPLRAAWRPHDNDRDPQRRLRLGFVSADLGRHPVGYFLLGALEHLDKQQGEVVCYSDRLTPDDLTARFRAAATTWHDTASWTDERLAEQVRADRIDILFDLAGHTARNRLLVFARKPAPLQVTWAGYVGTTGLSAVDYLLADRYQVPPEAEPFYRERVLRLPDGYVCYTPPREAPPVGPLPAREPGTATFGSFNNPAKITAEVLATWARVLTRLPQARLVLRYNWLDDRAVAGRITQYLAQQGIASERVTCRGWASHAELLAAYHDIDVALDPFPYSGGLTTCEALWMGVPVVTCPGTTFASRHSLSHLANVGLTETIARDREEYVELAVALAQDRPRLADLRARLRQQMAASPLCDADRFAVNLMKALREVWRQWAREGRSG